MLSHQQIDHLSVVNGGKDAALKGNARLLPFDSQGDFSGLVKIGVG